MKPTWRKVYRWPHERAPEPVSIILRSSELEKMDMFTVQAMAELVRTVERCYAAGIDPAHYHDLNVRTLSTDYAQKPQVQNPEAAQPHPRRRSVAPRKRTRSRKLAPRKPRH